MPSYSIFLHFPFITFIILLALSISISISNGEINANYSICLIPYSCGKIKNIRYPFWGEDRPKFCGISELKLSCQQDHTTSMNVLRNGSFEFAVLDINTSDHSLVISKEKLFKYCFVKNTTESFLYSLKTDTSMETIHIYYNCVQCSTINNFNNSFICTSEYDQVDYTAYYFGNPPNLSRFGKSCACNGSVDLLMDKRGLGEFDMQHNSLDNVLRHWPNATLKYFANFTACFECEKSGGRCGSSGDMDSEQFLCHCPDGSQSWKCLPSKKENRKVIVGLGTGGLVLVVVAMTVFWLYKKLKPDDSQLVTRNLSDNSESDRDEKGSMYFAVPLFSYTELKEATQNFDRSKELGEGGYGIVYYGKLKDGREVAVKCLYEKNYKRVEQFINEVKILTSLRHQNLVSIYGSTSHNCRELLLVYEYVKNGTLADHLYGKNSKSGSLPWHIRLRIAIETANALSYLHASDIIHRDVKTNNILLDSKFTVKVADFGLSRLFPNDATHISTAPQGTPGYLDPEYYQCYHLTDKSDVYSFGVVLLELISSMPAVDMNRHTHEINLSHYGMHRIQQSAYDELVDPNLGFASDFRVRRMITLMAELAFWCLQPYKDFRPSMDEVLETLKKIESTDFEALQAEEMAQNRQMKDCGLQLADAKAKNGAVEVGKMRSRMTLSLPTENDYSKLVSNQWKYASSPISVMENWVSGSTIGSTSK